MLLQIGYLSLTALTIIFLLKLRSIATSRSEENSKNGAFYLLIPLIIWHIFIFVISKGDFLIDYSFPPKFAVFMIIPSFIFTGVFIYRNRNKNWLLNIPHTWIIFFQTFRVLVETLFVLSVAKGFLHPEVTIEGYNFDMIFALTAPFMGYALMKNFRKYRKVAISWNLLGLGVIASIIFLFMTTIYIPEWYGHTDPMLPPEALTYPYVLIAGFLMPVAVFLHVLSIVQLKKAV